MRVELNEIEARVLGSLVEKSLTTPELYPLTMNGLVNACNQKTSREPVMTLSEAEAGQALHSLLGKSLAGRLHEPGARVPKFMHHVEHLLPGSNEKHVALICALLLRGPQTPGELKSRTDRLAKFESTAEVEALLQEMGAREEPWVERLPRQPGQKETRYRQLFTAGSAPAADPVQPDHGAPSASAQPDRVAALEARVAALEEQVKSLLAGKPAL